MALTLRSSWDNLSAGIHAVARGLCVFCSASLLCAPLYGIDRDRRVDELYHTSWTLKDGAPSEIYAIAQTVDGYLWLGTTTGLVRFDGVHFENYEQTFGHALPGRNVSSLLADPKGGLWLGFSTGQVSMVRGGQITTYGPSDGLPPSTVRSLVRDRRGRIWAASVTGLSQFDGSRWKSIGADWDFSGGTTTAFADREGTVWIGTPDRLLSLPDGAGKFQTAAQHLKYVTALAQAANGAVWMAQLSGTISPVAPSTTSTGYLERNGASLKFLFDDQGSLWAASLGTGLLRASYPERLDSVKPSDRMALIEIHRRARGLTSDYTEAVFQDSEGDIWVGTSIGLDRFRQSAVISAYASTPYLSLAPGDQGTVWVAPSGWPMLRLRDRRFPDPLPSEFDAIRRRGYTCIHRDAEGALWMAADSGLSRMAGQRLSEFPYPNRTRSDTGNRGAAIAMTEGRSGSMWVSMPGDGVYRLASGNWTSLETLGGPKGVALSAFTEPGGRVWLGMLDLSVVRIEDGQIRVFSAHEGVEVGKVRSIHAHGVNVWIGGDVGAARFDEDGFRALVPSGGKSLRDVFGILETDEGLWMSENSGILFVPHSEILAFEKDPKHQVSFRSFGFLHGLDAPLQRSTASPALIQSTDGLLWFATSQGMVFVNPKRIPTNTVPPPVSITSVVANARPYTAATGLALPNRVKNLQIDYTGISLAMPEQVRYRYKLEGYDTDWQDAGPRRQAFYTNPGPGSYTFRVIAVNSDGVWSESGAHVGFSIDFAFYETRWFQFLCALAAGGIVWLLYLFRLRLVTAQLKERLGERLQERERIARELHDTLLQSFQGLMLRFQVVDELLPPGKAKEQLEQSLERADQAIAEGRSAVHNLRSVTAGNDLGEALRVAAGELVREGGPTFRLVAEGQPRDLDSILRDEVYRIALEGLRNAFNHARAHHVEAEITYGERLFRLRIRDDGEGIPQDVLEAGRSGHYGLGGMRERARQTGAKLDIWSSAGNGTEIDLSFPDSIAYGAAPRRPRLRLFRRKVG